MPDRTPTRAEELETIRARDAQRPHPYDVGPTDVFWLQEDRHDLLARLDEAERLHEEDEGVIRVWRRRAEEADGLLREAPAILGDDEWSDWLAKVKAFLGEE